MDFMRRTKILALIFASAIMVNFYSFFGQSSVKTVYDIYEGPPDFSKLEALREFGVWGRYDFASESIPVEEDETHKTNELRKLSTEILTKIWRRQNPENCNQARLLIYDINLWQCGFGCTAHIILLHLLLAFYTDRTFVLKSNGWSYDKKGWEHYFMPLGKCEYDGWMWLLPELSDKTSNAKIVRSVSQTLYRGYDWKIPRNILAILKKNSHSDPFAWWIGQFLNYELRLQPWFMEVLEEKSKSVPIASTTVGLQIRWGDKVGREATRHEVPEYMNMASKWFKRSINEAMHKTVYVATEQSEVWRTLEDKYREFSFTGAGYVDRYKELEYQKGYHYEERKHELEAILTDIYFLSKCPYVVCTFSSNICRLLYEMVAVRNSKPRDEIQSLDEQFYWHMARPSFRVIEDHMSESNEDEIDLETGDIFVALLGSYETRKPGYKYVLGTSSRTGETGQVSMHGLKVILEPLPFDF